MPGLPKVPAAERIDIDENGMIENWSFDEYDFKKLDEDEY
jgi:hypothetical protein